MASAGRVLLIPKGDWESGASYSLLDVVYDGGSSFVAKQNIVNSTVRPVNDATNWQILAQGYGGSDSGYNILKRTKHYAVGDVAYSTSAPSWAQLVCVTAGTTASSEPAAYASADAGDEITDGTASFIVYNASMKVVADQSCRTAFRNYSLGNQFTTEQAQMIAAGDFADLVNGGYWDVSGIKVRIADNRNWYKYRGDQGNGFETPHLVIMPDENILKADGSTTRYMQDTNTTEGGYAGVKYRSQYKAQAKKFFTDFFGAAHIATYRGLISTAVNATAGRASNWAWNDCDVELPTESMMFGCPRWGDGAGSGYTDGSFHNQLALFQLAPEYIIARGSARESSWLQNVVSASVFAFSTNYGPAANTNASNSYVGVRPFALLI